MRKKHKGLYTFSGWAFCKKRSLLFLYVEIRIVKVFAGGGAVGTATITAAPLRRNRTTDFSGTLFAGGGALTILLDGDWLTFYEGTW